MAVLKYGRDLPFNDTNVVAKVTEFLCILTSVSAKYPSNPKSNPTTTIPEPLLSYLLPTYHSSSQCLVETPSDDVEDSRNKWRCTLALTTTLGSPGRVQSGVR